MLNPFQSLLLIVLGVVCYMMAVDENFAVYLTLIFRLIRSNIEKFWWIIKFHPQNPITNLIMRWKYDRIAKDLHQELIGNDGTN